MTRPRIIIADDHAMLREAFTGLLAPHCEIVATAGDGQELVEMVAEFLPEIVVLDIGMPRLSGIEAARIIVERHPGTRMVFLTVSDDPDLAAEALEAAPGAGFVVKDCAASELFQAIEKAQSGESYIAARIAGLIPENHHSLSPRQTEVLRLLAKGLAMKQVARELGITTRTVAHHKYTMMAALGIESSAELVSYAVRRGLA